ncbi:NACHT, LRR and PYD domains-containing protein 12 [Branchiostoma belcheri]|nr:NACHT, LRR and PYD domains-containing protein 12 [Branchiostoma belcheri]
MAAAGGDEPRRPPGPAHLYGSYKKLLLGIFDDMDNPEYRSFKHHLDCVVSSDNVSIPKARIMRAKRQDMPDLILRYIPRREALEVVARILQDLPNVQLLERIQQFTHPEPGMGFELTISGIAALRVTNRANSVRYTSLTAFRSLSNLRKQLGMRPSTLARKPSRDVLNNNKRTPVHSTILRRAKCLAPAERTALSRWTYRTLPQNVSDSPGGRPALSRGKSRTASCTLPQNVPRKLMPLGYMVMQIKHAADSEEDYLRTCQDIADVLNQRRQGLGNLILDEIRHRECVLVQYLLYMKELTLKRPADIIQKMASEECKKELRRLGVIYITVEDATLFTGDLPSDPRTWDPVEVTQWVARILLLQDQTATIPDLQVTGDEICAKPETWFTDNFPGEKGTVLYTDLQQRRDDVARQRKFGGRQEENERVVEKTSATFLVSAYLMSMILTLLGQHRKKAGDILEYLWSLIHVTETSVVFGSRAIAISSEAYSQVVTSVAEAMQVIGAPLERVSKQVSQRVS